MFDSLKKKFGSWLSKVTESEEPEEKKPKKSKVKAKKETKAQTNKEKKPKTSSKEKKTVKKIVKKSKLELAEVEVPMEFNPATEGYQPDLEKLKEFGEKVEKKTEEIAKETAEKIQEVAQETSKETKGFAKRFLEEVTSPFKREKKEDKAEKAKEEKKDKIQDFEEIKEDIKEEESVGFFSKLIKRVSTSTLTQEDFNEMFEEFEVALLENNVALEAVDKIRESLAKDLVNIEVKKGEAEKLVLQSLKDSIESILIEAPDLIKQIQEHIKSSPSSPYVILFFGINGSGKTTSVAKVASLLKKAKFSVVLAAADTFRAASIEQLQTHASKLQVPCIAHQYGSDPAAVAFDAIQYAKTHKAQVVLIDTAGRMYTKANLLKEMEKIIRVSRPNLKLFVGESITGNDATEQAKTFNESAGIDGIILSKADIDEKAGTILSVSLVTGKPIYFLGVGQKYEDLKEFKKKDVLKHLGLE